MQTQGDRSRLAECRRTFEAEEVDLSAKKTGGLRVMFIAIVPFPQKKTKEVNYWVNYVQLVQLIKTFFFFLKMFFSFFVKKLPGSGDDSFL